MKRKVVTYNHVVNETIYTHTTVCSFGKNVCSVVMSLDERMGIGFIYK